MTTTLEYRKVRPVPTWKTRSGTSFFLSCRSLSCALGVLWLLDGALQLQSFMFTKGFAHQIIAPSAVGQPWFVSEPVRWNALLITHYPVLCNSFFAAVQLAIGVGFLIPRLRRPAIVASVLWAGGVWYAGEGLGGVAGGHANALVGAPGAAVLYGVLAVAAWPGTHSGVDHQPQRPPYWLLPVWAVLWVGGAVLDLLPGNRPASTFSAQLAANASSVPQWLARFDDGLGRGVHSMGFSATIVVVALELAIGLAALGPRPARSIFIVTGIVLAAVYWAAGQSFGQLLSGQATDPSTGPLLILVGIAALSVRPRIAMRTLHEAYGESITRRGRCRCDLHSLITRDPVETSSVPVRERSKNGAK